MEAFVGPDITVSGPIGAVSSNVPFIVIWVGNIMTGLTGIVSRETGAEHLSRYAPQLWMSRKLLKPE
jgi:hypothetical protein